MSRYIPNTSKERKQMFSDIGLQSFEELLTNIPDEIRLKRKLNIPDAMSEMELLKRAEELAGKNADTGKYMCFLGAGCYDHYIPAVISHILSRQEFYTAYTPYQPEISQGILQAMFEYQTMICELTGMDASNASLYDGATSVAEAAAMVCRDTGKKQVLAASSMHPEYRHVLRTYARFGGHGIKELRYNNGQLDLTGLESAISADTAAVVVQTPNFFGIIENLEDISRIVHQHNAFLIVSTDPVSLGILKPPGSLGADIVVGEGQPLGNPMSFGGPFLGFFAVTGRWIRKMPGRVVGVTSDKHGKRAYTLTIQTREQHIRREKATSNICSNQALNALTAAAYLTVMGKQGFCEVAEQCLRKSHYAYDVLLQSGQFAPVFKAPFFKEFVVKPSIDVAKLNQNLLQYHILGGYPLEKEYPNLPNCWLLAVTEKRTHKEIDMLAEKALEIIKGGM